MTLSNFGLGCWVFGLAEPASREERDAQSVIREAYDRGVRHFDTAQGYGDGRSEEIVGASLAAMEDARIATKTQLLSQADTAQAVDVSRRRLRRDTLDLFYVHWPKRDQDVRPMLAALEQERARGRVRRIGVSNFSARDLQNGCEVATIDVHQIGYSLLWRYPETEVIPYCRANNIELCSYSSLAQGLLTGKMPRRPSFAPGDPRPATVFYDEGVWPSVYSTVMEMKRIAESSGCELHHAALHWLVHRAGMSWVLVGARNVAQLLSNLVACVAQPDGDILTALETASDAARAEIPDIGNIFKYYP
jgi:myo-inositol catabolism protein IolS